MSISVVGSICPVQGWWRVEASILHIYCGCCMCNVCNQHTPFVCFGILAGNFNLLQSGLHRCGHCAFDSRWYIYSHPFGDLTNLFTKYLNCWLQWGARVLRRWCYCLQIHYLVLWIFCLCDHSSNTVDVISLPLPKVVAFSSFQYCFLFLPQLEWVSFCMRAITLAVRILIFPSIVNVSLYLISLFFVLLLACITILLDFYKTA